MSDGAQPRAPELRRVVALVVAGSALTWAACGLLGALGLMQGISQLGSLATGRDRLAGGLLGLIDVRVAIRVTIACQLVGTAAVASRMGPAPRALRRVLLALVGGFVCGPATFVTYDWLCAGSDPAEAPQATAEPGDGEP